MQTVFEPSDFISEASDSFFEASKPIFEPSDFISEASDSISEASEMVSELSDMKTEVAESGGKGCPLAFLGTDVGGYIAGVLMVVLIA